MESVKKARLRMRMYPQLLAKCSETAMAYSTCVVKMDSVKRYDCQKEFDLFKNCLAKAAKELKTRL